MKAKKNLALVAAGIVIGAFLAFPTAHAAEELFTAVRSSHQFFLDGEKVQMEAYIINGNNYVKLADVGKMVGFNVYWDGAVYMDSDAPYTGKAPEASSTLEEVREEIAVRERGTTREWSPGTDYRSAPDGSSAELQRSKVYLASHERRV